MICVGIDIGVSGAIAVLFDSGDVHIEDMPTIVVSGSKTKTEVNPVPLARIMRTLRAEHKDLHVVAEVVHAFPKQGVVSVFNFGRSAGVTHGILAALQIPYTLVQPARWKAAIMAGMGKEKEASVVRALQLFPGLESKLITERGRKIDGRADALLMAYWLQQELAFGSIKPSMVVGLPPSVPDEEDEEELELI